MREVAGAQIAQRVLANRTPITGSNRCGEPRLCHRAARLGYVPTPAHPQTEHGQPPVPLRWQGSPPARACDYSQRPLGVRTKRDAENQIPPALLVHLAATDALLSSPLIPV